MRFATPLGLVLVVLVGCRMEVHTPDPLTASVRECGQIAVPDYKDARRVGTFDIEGHRFVYLVAGAGDGGAALVHSPSCSRCTKSPLHDNQAEIRLSLVEQVRIDVDGFKNSRRAGSFDLDGHRFVYLVSGGYSGGTALLHSPNCSCMDILETAAR